MQKLQSDHGQRCCERTTQSDDACWVWERGAGESRTANKKQRTPRRSERCAQWSYASPERDAQEKVSFELARAKLGRCVTCSRELRDYDGTMPY